MAVAGSINEISALTGDRARDVSGELIVSQDLSHPPPPSPHRQDFFLSPGTYMLVMGNKEAYAHGLCSPPHRDMHIPKPASVVFYFKSKILVLALTDRLSSQCILDFKAISY